VAVAKAADAEKARQAAETNAADAEKARQAAEVKAADAEKARRAAAASIDDADKARRTAEAQAADAERLRQAAVAKADDADKARRTAEAQAAIAERARQAAETKAAQTIEAQASRYDQFVRLPEAGNPEANRNAAQTVTSSLFIRKRNIEANAYTSPPYIGASSSASISDCEQTCARNNTCSIYTYNKKDGFCYLFSSTATLDANENYDSGIRN
jgi:PAN domain